MLNGQDGSVGSYSATTNAWTDLAPLPNGVNGGFAAALGSDGHIYSFGQGGVYRVGTCCVTATHSVASYDAATNTWTCAKTDTSSGCAAFSLPPMPTARVAASAVSDPANGLIYVIGGTTASNPPGPDAPSTVVEAYNPAARTWLCSTGDRSSGCGAHNSSLAPMPTARDSMAAVLGADGRIYVLGGEGKAGVTSVVEAYDPTTNTWSCSVGDGAAGCGTQGPALSPLPTGRMNLAAAAAPDGTIYTFGGWPNATSGPVSVVEGYQPASGVWTCSQGDMAPGCIGSLLPMPAARGYFAAATLPDGRIATVGTDSSLWNELEIFTPPATQVSRPSLAVAPPSGSAGSRVGLHGAGFTAGETISLYVDFPQGTPFATFKSPGSTFAWSGALPRTLAAGPHLLYAAGSLSGQSNGAPFQLTRVSLVPVKAQLATYAVQTAGFQPDETIAVSIENGSKQRLYSTTGPAPGFQFTASLSQGRYIVSVVGQSSGYLGATTLAVAPQLLLNPTSGSQTTTIAVSGSGFAAGQTVTIAWGCAAAPCSGTTQVTADGSGAFGSASRTVGPASLTPPAGTAVGTYPIGASAGSVAPYLYAGAKFTVTS